MKVHKALRKIDGSNPSAPMLIMNERGDIAPRLPCESY